MNQRYRPITRLGLGGTGLGDMYHTTSDAAATSTVDAAWDAGIRYFDTAPHYGAGLSEHRFGQALRRHPRHAYTLSTKVGRLLAPHMPGEIEAPFVGALPFKRVIDYTADGVRRSVEDSLQRLVLGHIDIAYVHDLSPDMFGKDFEHHYRTAAGKGGAHPVVAATIPGASSPEHLRRNATLMHMEIPGAFWDELRAEGLVPPDAPLPPRKAAA